MTRKRMPKRNDLRQIQKALENAHPDISAAKCLPIIHVDVEVSSFAARFKAYDVVNEFRKQNSDLTFDLKVSERPSSNGT